MKKEIYYIISIRRNHADCTYLPITYIEGLNTIDVNTGEILFNYTPDEYKAYCFTSIDAAKTFIETYVLPSHGEKYIIAIVEYYVEKHISDICSYNKKNINI